jgi:hypothetical protein
MEDCMTVLTILGIAGSFLVAVSMAWSVPPPMTPDPMERPTTERRR